MRLIPFFRAFLFFCAVGVHGVAFGGAGFVNDAFEQAADGGVGQRAGIGAFGVGKDFVFAFGLIEREVGRLFQLADFEGAAGTLVEKLDELFVDFVDAAAPVGEIHQATPLQTRREISRFARNDGVRIARQSY
jgi:hypothetical protein